jgi:hypothetical protein
MKKAVWFILSRFFYIAGFINCSLDIHYQAKPPLNKFFKLDFSHPGLIES